MQLIKTICFNLNIMTPEKKIVSNLKARPGIEPAKPNNTAITRTYCRQKGKIYYYVTPKPLGHPVSQSD